MLRPEQRPRARLPAHPDVAPFAALTESYSEVRLLDVLLLQRSQAGQGVALLADGLGAKQRAERVASDVLVPIPQRCAFGLAGEREEMACSPGGNPKCRFPLALRIRQQNGAPV